MVRPESLERLSKSSEMINEGKAKIKIRGDVFYNPRMKFCRDVDMVVFGEIKEIEGKKVDYLDALSGTGIRGIRSALEADYNPFFNDINRKAVENIIENLRLNGLNAQVFNMDASILMREKPFLHVDVDPFGSPAEFIDSACVRPKYLSVTATDTAALCGSAPNSGLRKYASFALKTEYYPEIGLRMLIGKIVSESTKYDKAPEVIVAYTKEHYYRVHLKFRRSPNAAKKVYKNYGYLFHCFECLRRYWVPVGEGAIEMCECGKKMKMMGPLWLGDLHDEQIISEILSRNPEKHVKSLIDRISCELSIPFFYDLHYLSRKLCLSPPQLNSLLVTLKELGFDASKTRFSGTSFKTNAPLSEIESAIRDIKQN
jgi:tRNA (guanine26-N2/guanine27-N2)-dimethyltransferase